MKNFRFAGQRNSVQQGSSASFNIGCFSFKEMLTQKYSNVATRIVGLMKCIPNEKYPSSDCQGYFGLLDHSPVNVYNAVAC